MQSPRGRSSDKRLWRTAGKCAQMRSEKDSWIVSCHEARQDLASNYEMEVGEERYAEKWHILTCVLMNYCCS